MLHVVKKKTKKKENYAESKRKRFMVCLQKLALIK